MPVFAEQHDADLVLVHVEGDAEHAAGKLDQLLEAHAGQAGDPGDAGGDAGDRADLARRQLRREGFPRLADAGERAVEDALQAFRRAVHWRFCQASALGCGCRRSGLALLFQQFADALLQRREIIRDAPRHLLSVRGEFDAADQVRRGLEPERGCRPRRFR